MTSDDGVTSLWSKLLLTHAYFNVFIEEKYEKNLFLENWQLMRNVRLLELSIQKVFIVYQKWDYT